MLAVLPAAVLADPVVPGFVVTPYASVTDPTSLSFAADGTLYVGRDASGSGGGSGDAVKIHRVAPGGALVEEFGDAALFDPDGVLVDEAGVVSGTPGAVLVCGVDPLSQGSASAIAPDQSITTVLGPTGTLQNPNFMAFDSAGALLVSDSGGAPGVYRFPAGGPLAPFLAPVGGTVPDNLAVDGTGRIFVHLSNGDVAVYDAAGVLEDASFASGLGTSGPLTFGPGGVWGTDLYAGVGDTLVRIDAQGTPTTIGTGFTEVVGMAFGPDGALYVSEFGLDRIVRIDSFTADWEAASGLLPDQVCPAWTLGDTASPEDPTLAGDTLVLSTDTGVELLFYSQTAPLLAVSDPLVIEARLQFGSGTSSAIRTVAGVGFFDGMQGNDLFVGQDEIFLLADATTRGPSATVDTDDAAHTYRVEMDGTGMIRVFYDGVQTLTGTAFASGSAPEINFGDLTDQPDVIGSASWEFVRHNAAVCVPPTTSTTTSTTTTTITSTTLATTTTSTTLATTTSTLASTTTTVPTTTSSTATSSSTSTTTTLPPGGCTVAPTFSSILCRIDALRTRVLAETGLGAFQPKLAKKLDKAVANGDLARSACGEDNAKKARGRLRKTVKSLTQYVYKLGSRGARKQLDTALREELAAAGEPIATDAGLLRDQLECPGDAAG